VTRFMVSMPDEMVKKLDRRAKDEHRTRSELLCEALQQHLATAASGRKKLTFQSKNRKRKGQRWKKWTKEALQQYLLEKGIVQKGCPGLDAMLGPVKGPVDMKRVLEIGRKLTGLTRQIIADREDRV
jgi:predicted DNA-binding protein